MEASGPSETSEPIYTTSHPRRRTYLGPLMRYKFPVTMEQKDSTQLPQNPLQIPTAYFSKFSLILSWFGD
jgi:hypothetical protein